MAMEDLVICLAVIVQLLTVNTAVRGQHVKVLIFNVTVQSHTDPQSHRPISFSSQFARDQFMEFYRCLCDQDILECRAHTSLYGTVTYTQPVPRLPVTHAQRDAFSSRHRCQADLDTLTVLCTRLLYSDPLCSHMTGCVSYQLVNQAENGQCPAMEIVWETGQTLNGHYDDQLIQLQPCDLSCDADVTAIATTASSITSTTVSPTIPVPTIRAGSSSQLTTPNSGVLLPPPDKPKTLNETQSTFHQNEPQYYSNDHSNHYTDNNYHNYDTQHDYHAISNDYTDIGHKMRPDNWNNNNDNDFASTITNTENNHYQNSADSFLESSDNDYNFGAGTSKSTNLTIGLGIGALIVLLGLLLLLILLRKLRLCRIQHVNPSPTTQKLSGAKLLEGASAVLPSQSKQALCAEELKRDSSYVDQINMLYEPAHPNHFQTFPYSHYEEIAPIPKVDNGTTGRHGDSPYAVATCPAFTSSNDQQNSESWAVNLVQIYRDIPPTRSKSHYDRSIESSEKIVSNERCQFNSRRVDSSLYCTVSPKTAGIVPTHYEEMVHLSYETSAEETGMKNMITSMDFCAPPVYPYETNSTCFYKRVDPKAKICSSTQSGNLYEEISDDPCKNALERTQSFFKTNDEVAKLQAQEGEMGITHGSRHKRRAREDRETWYDREASLAEQDQDMQRDNECLEVMDNFVSLSDNVESSDDNEKYTYCHDTPRVEHYLPMGGQIVLSDYVQTDKYISGQTQRSEDSDIDLPTNDRRGWADPLLIREEQADFSEAKYETKEINYSNITETERQTNFSEISDNVDGANCPDNEERQTNYSDISDEIDKLDCSDNTDRQTNFSDISDEIDGLSSSGSTDERDQTYYSQISEDVNQTASKKESERVLGKIELRGHYKREESVEQEVYSKINKHTSVLQDKQSRLSNNDRDMLKTSRHVADTSNLRHSCQSSNLSSNHCQSFPHLTPPPDNPPGNQPIKTNSALLASREARQDEERSKQGSGLTEYGQLYVNSPATTVSDPKSVLPAWLDDHFYYELESDHYSCGSRNSGKME